MYHHNKIFPSTGEPPTTDSQPLLEREMVESNRRVNSSQDLSVQEPDSGYEASPSSTNGTFSFDESKQNVSEGVAEDESSFDTMLADYDVAHEDDIVDPGFYNDSSNLTQWPFESTVHEEDEDDDDDDPDFETPQERMSSSPIAIPTPDRLISSALPRLCSRSLPIPPSPTTPPMLPFSLILRVPLSWPRSQHSALSVNVPDQDVIANRRTRQLSATENSSRVRSRRRLIDSDASSVSSSDADVEEAVLPAVSSAPSGRLALPDVVPLQSCQMGNGVRRSRSVSINLPLDREQRQTYHEIGQALRRMSDQFADNLRSRNTIRPRSNTIGEFFRCKLNRFDELRRPRGDDDDANPNCSALNCAKRS